MNNSMSRTEFQELTLQQSGDVTRTMFNDETNMFSKKVENNQILLASDIEDPYLRAAFEGDEMQIMNLQYQMKKDLVDDLELWNKSLLAFVLAISNNSLRTANSFVKKYDKLRTILQKLYLIFEQTTDLGVGTGIRQSSYGPTNIRTQSAQVGLRSQQRIQQMQMDVKDMKRSQNQDNSNESYDFTPEKPKKKGRNSKVMKELSFKDPSDAPEIRSDKKISKEKGGFTDSESEDDEENQESTDNSLINRLQFQSLEDLQTFQRILKSEVSSKFMTNVLKIALNYQEDKISAIIVANYQVQVDEGIIDYAIMNEMMKFLHNIFLFEKNEILVPSDEVSNNDNGTQSNQQNAQKSQDDEEYVRTLTIDELVAKIGNSFDFKYAEPILMKVLSWKIKPEQNILKLLCEIGHERIATHFMNQYQEYSDWNFFFDCIFEERQFFIKHALKEQYFNWDYMFDSRAIDWILDRFKSGYSILYPLNLLLFTDFRKWDLNQLEQFTIVTEMILDHNLETNFMLITTNPVMTLGLIIQYLWYIKRYFNAFDMECVKLRQKLELLGNRIVHQIPFEQIEEIFLERDFTDRSVLNIITENDIMTFVAINKLRFLIDKIWYGKDSDSIDGKISHFSKTKYLLSHEIKSIKGVRTKITDIIGDTFKPSIENFNFIYQYKFRMQSIMIIFLKDFVCATLIVCIFQYINYSYLNLFTERQYMDLAYDEQISYLKDSLKKYNQFNFIGTILSISYFLNFLCRLIYNSRSRKKIYLDIWLMMDLVAGIVNIAAFNSVGRSSPEKILNINNKRFFDYYMIVVLIISWLRFFSYFLVISTISKLTLTLMMMLKETLNFLFILSCYLIIITTVFATLFRDCDTDDAQDYHELMSTLRAMIDYFLANFQNKEMGNYNTSHSVLVIIHVVISNMFLLNFLVAILTTVYEIMHRNGDFYAIEYQYLFITKYMKAMEEDNGYDKLILYPPPLNFFLFPLIIVSPSRNLTKKMSVCISKTIFWVENVCLIMVFFGYMLIHAPLIMVKIHFQIINKIDGVCHKILYIMLWSFFGFFYILYVNLRDTCMFINVLCLEASVVFDQGEDERNKLLQLKFFIYRDIMRAMRQLNYIAESTSVLFNKRQHLMIMFTQKLTISEKIEKQDNEMKIDDLYIVRKELIIAAYEQISAKNPFLQAYRKAVYERGESRKSSLGVMQELEVDRQAIKENERRDPDINPEFKEIVSKILMSHNRDNMDELIDFMRDQANQENENGKKVYLMVESEQKLLESFLGRFTMMQKNQESTTINLSLVLKALPKIFTKQQIQKVELLQFQRMQKILISFFNDDQDEMFNYYDNRMTRRLAGLKKLSSKNEKVITKILNFSKTLYESSQHEEALHKFAKQSTILSSKQGDTLKYPQSESTRYNQKQSSVKFNLNGGASVKHGITNSVLINGPQPGIMKKKTGSHLQSYPDDINESDGGSQINMQRGSIMNSSQAPKKSNFANSQMQNSDDQNDEDHKYEQNEEEDVINLLVEEEKKIKQQVQYFKKKQERLIQQEIERELKQQRHQNEKEKDQLLAPHLSYYSSAQSNIQDQRKASMVNRISNANSTMPKFELPSADQILQQIRAKRKTLTRLDSSDDDSDGNAMDYSNSDASQDEVDPRRKSIQERSVRNSRSIKGRASVGSKRSSTVKDVNDSFKSDTDEDEDEDLK